MEINLDKEAIERAVTSAIVQSAIGDKIKKAIGDSLTTYNNPIDAALKQVIADLAMKICQEQFEEQIREAVKKKLEETTVDAFVSRFWDAVLDKKW